MSYINDKETVKLTRFTELIHDKGYTVGEFCNYWGISKRTYERYLADEAKHDKLEKMIRGMK